MIFGGMDQKSYAPTTLLQFITFSKIVLIFIMFRYLHNFNGIAEIQGCQEDPRFEV